VEELGIPPDIRRLIDEYIDSVEKLEILLLLHRTRPRQWRPAAISAELRTSEHSAALRLAELAAVGLAQATGEPVTTYAFAGEADAQAAVAKLAAVYDERRVSVITAIFSKPHSSVRTFADAFRWKKEPSDG
jgi:hypothetical protein